MKETTNNEVMETMEEATELEVVEEKKGFFAKVKEGAKKHKKGLIIGGVVVTILAVGGAVLKALSGKSEDECEDCDCDYYEDDEDIIDSEAVEVE